MGGNGKIEGNHGSSGYAELWADNSPRVKKTIPVKVHCETKTNGEESCRIDQGIRDLLYGTDEYKKAAAGLGRFLQLGKVTGAEKKGDGAYALAAGALAIALPSAETLPWIGAGAATAAEVGAVAAAGGYAAPLIIGAAAFGPPQSVWERENSLIQFAVESERDITVNVVVESGTAETAADIAKADLSAERPAGGGPKGPDGGKPPGRWRTWREIFAGIKEKAGKFYRLLKDGDGRANFWEWFKNRYVRNGEARPSEKIIKPEDVSWPGWVFQRVAHGFREFFSGHFARIQRNLHGTAKCVNRYVHHPVLETLDILNRPGRLLVLTSDIYGLLRLFTASVRRITGSKKINPLGSGLVPEEYEGVAEPVLGIFGSAALGGMIEHYLFGWGRGAAFVFEGVFAYGSAMLQSRSGGAMRKNIDWNRLDLSTAVTAVVWGPVSVYNRVARTAFPSIKWGEFLKRLAENGHTTASNVLKAVPRFVAPEVLPSRESILTYLGLMTGHTYAVLPIDAWSDNENPEEYFKSITTKLSTYLIVTRWFDLAFSTYTRPAISLISSVAEINLSAKFSEFFQIYKGKRFYREPFHDMVRFDVERKKAIEQITSALCSNNFFDAFWKLEDEDWYDFAQDIYSGEFTKRETEYFRAIALDEEISEPKYARVRRALKALFEGRFKSREETFNFIKGLNSGRI